MLQGHRRQRDKAIGVCRHPLGESLVLRPDDLACEVAIGRVPPVAIDAQRLDIDALLIHELQTLRAEDVVPATASHAGQRRALDDVLHRDDAVRVHVDHPDAAAAHHHLASCGLSLKRGGHGAGTAAAHHIRARRSGHDRPEEVPAICHIGLNSVSTGMTRSKFDMVLYFCRSGLSVTQHPGDRGDGIPVARGDRDPKEPVERAEVADGLHVAPVHAEDEPVVPREDLQQPLAAGRKAHGRRRRRAGAFGQDAHEADDVGSHGLVREMILRHQPDNLAALADHDLGIKGKPACQFGAELRPGDWPPDHEGARRADVDGIEVLQLFGERGRSEGPVTADVDPSQKNHECHAFPPGGRLDHDGSYGTISTGASSEVMVIKLPKSNGSSRSVGGRVHSATHSHDFTRPQSGENLLNSRQ